jgi:hypothetical protein
VIPVLGLAFVGLESGTLHFLAQASRIGTIVVFAALVVAIGYLGWKASGAPGLQQAPSALPGRA